MRALPLLPVLALLAGLTVVASGFGARFGLWDYRVAFRILSWGSLAAGAVALVALIALLVPRVRKGGFGLLLVAFLAAGMACALPLYWLGLAKRVPPINDVTTDTADPPAFVAVLPLREGTPVPAQYPGPATAKAQEEGYPDLQPLVLPLAPRAAFDRALAVAREMNWAMVATDPAAGRIEATATTPWFGFKDDVVIRIAATRQGSRVDIRSVSRVGKSDLGTNARRIREFLAKMAA